jgi:hypothetical protein
VSVSLVPPCFVARVAFRYGRAPRQVSGLRFVCHATKRQRRSPGRLAVVATKRRVRLLGLSCAKKCKAAVRFVQVYNLKRLARNPRSISLRSRMFDDSLSHWLFVFIAGTAFARALRGMACRDLAVAACKGGNVPRGRALNCLQEYSSMRHNVRRLSGALLSWRTASRQDGPTEE